MKRAAEFVALGIGGTRDRTGTDKDDLVAEKVFRQRSFFQRLAVTDVRQRQRRPIITHPTPGGRGVGQFDETRGGQTQSSQPVRADLRQMATHGEIVIHHQRRDAPAGGGAGKWFVGRIQHRQPRPTFVGGNLMRIFIAVLGGKDDAGIIFQRSRKSIVFVFVGDFARSIEQDIEDHGPRTVGSEAIKQARMQRARPAGGGVLSLVEIRGEVEIDDDEMVVREVFFAERGEDVKRIVACRRKFFLKADAKQGDGRREQKRGEPARARIRRGGHVARSILAKAIHGERTVGQNSAARCSAGGVWNG